MGIVARADAARAHTMRHTAGKCFRRFDLIRQCLQRFHHRAIVGCMHDWAGGVSDEVEQAYRRALAIEFGEKREHAATDFCFRERGARCLI